MLNCFAPQGSAPQHATPQLRQMRVLILRPIQRLLATLQVVLLSRLSHQSVHTTNLLTALTVIARTVAPLVILSQSASRSAPHKRPTFTNASASSTVVGTNGLTFCDPRQDPASNIVVASSGTVFCDSLAASVRTAQCKPAKSVTCTFCARKGHIAPRCWYKFPAQKPANVVLRGNKPSLPLTNKVALVNAVKASSSAVAPNDKPLANVSIGEPTVMHFRSVARKKRIRVAHRQSC